jgi:hypothetical protein
MLAARAAHAHPTSSGSGAQIGQIVGQMAAKDADERACMNGELPGDWVLEHGKKGAEKLFTAYWSLRTSEDRGPVAKLYSQRWRDVSLKLPDGPDGLDAMKAFMAQRGPIESGFGGVAPVPIGLVVADDGEEATGVWDVPGHGRYTMDIIWERNGMGFGLGWRILHLRLTPLGSPLPPMPTQYCHSPGDVKPH